MLHHSVHLTRYSRYCTIYNFIMTCQMIKHRIHVFSIIPQLPQLLAKRFPEQEFKVVKIEDDFSNKYGKIVTEDELSQLQDAKILVVDGNLLSGIYQKITDVKWVQCTWAGVESFLKQQKESGTKPAFTLTRMGNSTFSQLLAEYTVGWILNCERGWIKSHEYQKQRQWVHEGKIAIFRSLKELTVGVLGVGLIGSEIIRALKFFNCKVYGLGRSATPSCGSIIDKYFSSEELTPMLKDCDYLVNILPSTPETKNILGGDKLQAASKKPVLINIGRGDVITEKDLLRALDEKWISAAVVDVFEKEPLLKESPLWSHPNVHVTPHVGGVSRAEDVVQAFDINLNLFIGGRPLKHVVDWDKGY